MDSEEERYFALGKNMPIAPEAPASVETVTKTIGVRTCKQAGVLKNSFLLNSHKQNCVKRPYTRSSRIARPFLSPNFDH
jgi:hypothetical protein